MWANNDEYLIYIYLYGSGSWSWSGNKMSITSSDGTYTVIDNLTLGNSPTSVVEAGGVWINGDGDQTEGGRWAFILKKMKSYNITVDGVGTG